MKYKFMRQWSVSHVPAMSLLLLSINIGNRETIVVALVKLAKNMYENRKILSSHELSWHVQLKQV